MKFLTLVQDLFCGKNGTLTLSFIPEELLHNGEFCRDFFLNLADIEYSPEEALQEFSVLASSCRSLEKQLGRPVDLRMAYLDRYLHRTSGCTRFTTIQTQEQLHSQAEIDPLTGIYNRRKLMQMLRTELQRSQRHDFHLSVAMFDLDNFKRINDKYGHPTGDEVLKNFTTVLQKELRSEDAAGRFGGEEFTLILPQTESNEALSVCNRLLRAVKSYAYPHSLRVTASCGIAAYPVHAETVDGLIEIADRGLYLAKENGKNQAACIFEDQRSDRHADKRSDKRRSAELPALVHTGNQDYSAVISDISRLGLGIVAPSSTAGREGPGKRRGRREKEFYRQPEIKPGSIIRVRTSGPKGSNEPAEIIAQVVWVSSAQEELRFGARYDDESLPSAINTFSDYLA
ncbi:MAG: diguanylate cyclase [Spirochaetales bacterium]|nr:diguanylate cyclase [Spirochaetales bacterium]MCF7938530.1 diguanylate cyclase [Spirochaetales bacterium]